MSTCKHFLGILVCVVLSSQAWSQVANSPFSQFGIGEIYSDALANTQGSGGIGVSQPQFWYINNQNPALLVYNSYTCFQGGIMGQRNTLSNNFSTEKHAGGNMNYLVTAFPVKIGKWTTSLGLMPYSTIKYKFQTQEPIEGTTDFTRVGWEGRGGLTQLYWSNGVRIYKNFSLGVKAQYLFGTTYRVNTFPQTLGYVFDVEDKNFIKNFNLKIGGSYSKDSIGGSNYRLSVGAVYGLATNAKTEYINKVAQLGNQGDTIPGSSIENLSAGITHLPPSITTGISISKGSKWMLGTELHYQDWSSFTSPDKRYILNRSWRTSIGGEFTPDADAIEGLLKRVTYRAGVVWERYPFTVSNKPVKDFGVNFGFSIPAGRSNLDFAFKVGKRGNKSENILEENYFKIYFGITFNDVWFIKRKFD